MFMDVYDNGTEEGGKFEPVGTNLFTAEQAKEMFRFLLEHEDGTSALTSLTEAHKQHEHEMYEELEKAHKVTENTSDGYHTFKELYEFRLLYNATLFNEWAKHKEHGVLKSKKHSDGEDCFGGGWFIVMAILPSGQISNHYEMKYWDMFQCDETLTGYPFDGHTPQDVAKRLREFNIEVK